MSEVRQRLAFLLRDLADLLGEDPPQARITFPTGRGDPIEVVVPLPAVPQELIPLDADERAIVLLVRDVSLQAKEIARKVGITPGDDPSAFRKKLSALVKKGALENPGRGYRATRRGIASATTPASA